MAVFVFLAMVSLTSQADTTTDYFGWGTNTFAISFVDVRNPGNPSDPRSSFEDHWASPKPPPDARLGAVQYVYRIGKYEIPNVTVEKANRLGGLLISNTNTSFTPSYWGPNKPVTFLDYESMARFINWLNTTRGHQPAYRFDEFGNWQLWSAQEAWQVGGQNLYRHKDAYYFLPSADEWHKAGYYDPVAGVYYRYPTGSDTQPIGVPGGTAPGTTVSFQPRAAGPADVENAGGLSPYGTMAQAGNLMDWNESAFDATNDSTTELIHIRGDKWYFGPGNSSYSDPWYPWGGAADCCTFRVASLPALVGDRDGDGIVDADELIAGTNPGDAADHLRLNVVMGSNYVELWFRTVVAPTYGYMDPRRYYTVEASTNAAGGGWKAVVGGERILGANQIVRLRPNLVGESNQFFRLRVWLEAGAMPQPTRGVPTTDAFGSGSNAFTIEFVTVRDPGNPQATNGVPHPMGRVGYTYRIGKCEVSEDMVNKAKQLGGLGITLSSRGPAKPATMMKFVERAKFVNWLNTSRGYQAAYNLDAAGNWLLWPVDQAWPADGTNQYRHKDAFYFLPSADEWFKAGYYDGTRYRTYPTASDRTPIGVASGLVGGTLVYLQSQGSGPADVDKAGGLSFYGTMAQGGNVREFVETAYDGTNNATSKILGMGGGCWFDLATSAKGITSGEGPWMEGEWHGFRVAARIPADP